MKTMNHTPTTTRAFTLIEVVVATAVSGVLLLALGSAVALASRAVPSGSEPVITEGAIGRACAVMQADIEETTDLYFGSTLLLAVPDRDGDGRDDLIEYAWAGTGNMLTRSHNRGVPGVLAGPVKVVSLTQIKAGTLLDRVQVTIVFADATPASRTFEVRTLNQPVAR